MQNHRRQGWGGRFGATPEILERGPGPGARASSVFARRVKDATKAWNIGSTDCRNPFHYSWIFKRALFLKPFARVVSFSATANLHFPCFS